MNLLAFTWWSLWHVFAFYYRIHSIFDTLWVGSVKPTAIFHLIQTITVGRRQFHGFTFYWLRCSRTEQLIVSTFPGCLCMWLLLQAWRHSIFFTIGQDPFELREEIMTLKRWAFPRSIPNYLKSRRAELIKSILIKYLRGSSSGTHDFCLYHRLYIYAYETVIMSSGMALRWQTPQHYICMPVCLLYWREEHFAQRLLVVLPKWRTFPDLLRSGTRLYWYYHPLFISFSRKSCCWNPIMGLCSWIRLIFAVPQIVWGVCVLESSHFTTAKNFYSDASG